MSVDEHTIELAGSPAFYRTAPAPGVPALYVHGVPTSSDDWISFLERSGGIAPDLIGFGRSGKGGNLDYTIGGLTDFLERLLEHLGIDRVKLVVHDWGAAVGLAFAQRNPERIERIVLINGVPVFPAQGVRWHRLARLWVRPWIGELVMGATTRGVLARTLRSGTADPNAWPDARIASIWKQFDQGTQRAILRLYRVGRRNRARAHRRSARPPPGPGADRLGRRGSVAAGRGRRDLRGGPAPRDRRPCAARRSLAVARQPRRRRPGGFVPPGRRVSTTLLDRPARERRPLLGGTGRIDPRRVAPTLVAAAFAAAYVMVSPPSLDLAAHLLRAKLFSSEGFGIWNNWWYGGHHVPGYSVLFPPIAAALTPQVAAGLAACGSAALFEMLARDQFGEDAWLGALWFGAGTATNLFTGRLTFAFGLLPAIASTLALSRRRTGWAVTLGVITALASPVAALFAALAAAAVAIGRFASERRLRAAIPGALVVIGALAPVALLVDSRSRRVVASRSHGPRCRRSPRSRWWRWC